MNFSFKDFLAICYAIAFSLFIAFPFVGLISNTLANIELSKENTAAAIQAIATFAGACLVIIAAKIQANGNQTAALTQANAERSNNKEQHLRAMIGYYRLKNIKFSAMARKLSRLDLYLKELPTNKKIMIEGIKKLHAIDIDLFDFSHDDLVFLGSMEQHAADALSFLGKKYVAADTALYNFRLYDFPEIFKEMEDEDIIEYNSDLPSNTNGNMCIRLATKCQKDLKEYREAVGKCWSAMILARNNCHSELLKI